MFNVIYRWRLKEGAEERFQRAWSGMTTRLRNDRGALGSRLHLADDGTWVAYAQWPDRVAWERSGEQGSADPALSAEMEDAIAERFDPILMNTVSDLLSHARSPMAETAPEGQEKSGVHIRQETPEDRERVYDVNLGAFGRKAEAKLVDMLREVPGPGVSLVAEAEGDIVGHIMFTPVEVEHSDKGLLALGLAPMAVVPEYQRKGVGSVLVQAGVDACKELDVDVVFVLGHADYYPKFGFESAATFGLSYGAEEFGPHFMVLELTPGSLKRMSGLVQYRQEFDGV